MNEYVRAALAAVAVSLLLSAPGATQAPQPAEPDAEEGAAGPAAPVPRQTTTVKAVRTTPTTVKAVLPIPAAARSDSPAFRGEGWFQQQCGVCHLGRWRKAGQLKASAPELGGVLANATPAREQAVREYIRQGSANMPGFRNTFTSAEFEELIAYLKSLERQGQ